MAWDARKYRLNAVECAEKARTAQTSQEKAAFLDLSARWIRLAEGVELEQALLAEDDDVGLADAPMRGITLLH